MQLQDAIKLINHSSLSKKNNANWADLGCGNGLFTYALANILTLGSSIYAADKASPLLQSLPNPKQISIRTQTLDFIKDPLPYHQLDGIMMANSLHYVADKPAFLQKAKQTLGETGAFLIVEYDTTKSNQWVPYPINNKNLEALFAEHGYHNYTLLGQMPSVFRAGNIYAALIKP
ncbi:MAG: methyltransferase domain-containing protein [Chitinophagaceae bacterium]